MIILYSLQHLLNYLIRKSVKELWASGSPYPVFSFIVGVVSCMLSFAFWVVLSDWGILTLHLD